MKVMLIKQPSGRVWHVDGGEVKTLCEKYTVTEDDEFFPIDTEKYYDVRICKKCQELLDEMLANTDGTEYDDEIIEEFNIEEPAEPVKRRNQHSTW